LLWYNKRKKESQDEKGTKEMSMDKREKVENNKKHKSKG